VPSKRANEGEKKETKRGNQGENGGFRKEGREKGIKIGAGIKTSSGPSAAAASINISRGHY
jgi:hypothetical protein